MRNYMLITVVDRDIYTEQFDTIEDAFNQMIKEMNEARCCDSDDLVIPDSCDEEYDDGDMGYHKYGGYLNDGANHGDYDWLIVCMS